MRLPKTVAEPEAKAARMAKRAILLFKFIP